MCKGWPHHRGLRPLQFSKSGVGSFYVPQEPNIKVKLLWDGTQGFSSLSEKTRKCIKPFVDVITKAALSSQLFIDPECWSGRGSNANSWISDI